MEPTGPGLEFRFWEEGFPEAHRVPARVLADTLAHSQRAVHLLAISAAGREIRQRARVPADLARHFVLECGVAAPGSYLQPVQLTTTGDLADVVLGAAVLERFQEVGHALSDGDWNAVRELVPDGAVRTRLVDEFVSMLPDPESGWVVDLRNGHGRTARFDSARVRSIREFQRTARTPAEALATPVTVTGKLIKIDFSEHKLTIRHHPTQRRIDCEYGPDVEDMLVESRRGLLRVTGLVELDEHDQPLRLTDVFDIHELDLSPIIVDLVPGTVRHLRARSEPLRFDVELDDDGRYLLATDPALDLDVFGHTRTELRAAILEQLEMMWLEYAEADEGQLTAGAATLAKHFGIVWRCMRIMRKQKDVEAALIRKGFREVQSHHRYFIYHTLAGLKSRIKTRTSHGGRDLDDRLLGHMAKQCGVARKDFLDLVDCPLDQETYEGKVADKL